MDQMEKTLMFYQDILNFLLQPCSESDHLLSLTWKNSSFRNPNGGDVMNTLTYECPQLYIINIYWVISSKICEIVLIRSLFSSCQSAGPSEDLDIRNQPLKINLNIWYVNFWLNKRHEFGAGLSVLLTNGETPHI